MHKFSVYFRRPLVSYFELYLGCLKLPFLIDAFQITTGSLFPSSFFGLLSDVTYAAKYEMKSFQFFHCYYLNGYLSRRVLFIITLALFLS